MPPGEKPPVDWKSTEFRGEQANKCIHVRRTAFAHILSHQSRGMCWHLMFSRLRSRWHGLKDNDADRVGTRQHERETGRGERGAQRQKAHFAQGRDEDSPASCAAELARKVPAAGPCTATCNLVERVPSGRVKDRCYKRWHRTCVRQAMWACVTNSGAHDQLRIQLRAQTATSHVVQHLTRSWSLACHAIRSRCRML